MLKRSLLGALLLLPACQTPYSGGFPPQPVWPGRSQALVLRDGSADVVLLASDPSQLIVTAPDGSQASFDQKGEAAFSMPGPGEIEVRLVEGSEPQYVTFRFQPTTDAARLSVEQRVEGEARPFFTEFVMRPWLQPGTGIELSVEGEDAQTRVITSGVDGAEVVFLSEVDPTQRIQRENDWLIRGPVRLRIDHHGDEKRQLSLGVWASEVWGLRKIDGVPEPGSPSDSGR